MPMRRSVPVRTSDPWLYLISRRRTSSTLTIACVAIALSLLVVASDARQAAPALTLSIKNSTAYAQPTPAPLGAALLIVTPSWAGVNAKTLAGGSEVPGQTLFVSELAVVLSSRKADCTSAFALGAPDNDKDFLIVAGRTEAYLPRRDWKSTVVGKVFAPDAADKDKNHLAVDHFSVNIQGGGLKKIISKDGLGGSNLLVLDQKDGQWTADVAVKTGDVDAAGKVPLTACPVENRSKNELPPLLGENRITSAVRSY
jgi:hypothetical protein